jgi:hypothetical protein
MRCPKCEFENPAGMKFCGKCRNCTRFGLPPIAPSKIPRDLISVAQCAAALHGAAGITKRKATVARPVAPVLVVAKDSSPTLEGERKRRGGRLSSAHPVPTLSFYEVTLYDLNARKTANFVPHQTVRNAGKSAIPVPKSGASAIPPLSREPPSY